MNVLKCLLKIWKTKNCPNFITTKDGLVGDKARLAWEMEAVKEEIERDQNNVIKRVFDKNGETKIGLGVIFSTLAFLLAL